jgi:hypothetical protein
MNKKQRGNNMKNKTILISTLLLFAVILVGVGNVLASPPPVPQTIGIQDISIINLTTNTTDQSVCRVCHQTLGTNLTGIKNGTNYTNTVVGGVPTRHHSLIQRVVTNPMTGAPFGCGDCHPSNPGGLGIVLDRSCLDCHAGINYSYNSIGGNVGNIARPHHINSSYASSNIGNPVANRTCNFCHGSVVDNYNDGHYSTFQDLANGTGYASDPMITPFASFKATSLIPDGLFPQGGNINFSTGVIGDSPTGGNKTWGGCYSCHLSNYSAKPQAIGSNYNNHHNTILGLSASRGGKGLQSARTTGAVCSWCHVVAPPNYTSPLEFNYTNPFTGETQINAMEVRNSTIEALSIFEPGTTNITVNGTGCEKCHDVRSLHNIQSNYVAGSHGQPGLGHINNNTDCNGCHADWVSSDVWTPGALIPTVNTVDPSVITVDTPTTLNIAGVNFVNDAYTSVVTVDGVTYTPTSITDSQIVVNIPALTAGIHTLQLVKGVNTLSNLETLTVESVVTVSSATLSGGTLTLTGVGLGSQPASNAQQYVTFNHAGNVYYSDAITTWNDGQIVATVSGSIAAGDTVGVITAQNGEVNANIVASAPADTTPPVITVNGSNPANITVGTAYIDAGATAVDAVDGSVPVTTTGTVNTNVIGAYTLTYTATDKSGNTATATRTVNVVPAKDTTPPVITVNGSNPVTIALGSTYKDAGATAVDAVDGSVPVTTTGTVNTNVVGTYILTYTATDKSGNTATATRTVNVAKPVLTTITVSPSPATVPRKGTQTFTATAKDQFGKAMSKISITWSSSLTTIGTVSPTTATTGTNGQATTRFTAKNTAGKTTVTAKSGTISGSSAVTVK